MFKVSFLIRKKKKIFVSIIECSNTLISIIPKRASRNIKAGETILLENPAIVAPAQNSFPVCVCCLGKLKNLDEDRCHKCDLPVCSERCQESTIHQPGM